MGESCSQRDQSRETEGEYRGGSHYVESEGGDIELSEGMLPTRVTVSFLG